MEGKLRYNIALIVLGILIGIVPVLYIGQHYMPCEEDEVVVYIEAPIVEPIPCPLPNPCICPSEDKRGNATGIVTVTEVQTDSQMTTYWEDEIYFSSRWTIEVIIGYFTDSWRVGWAIYKPDHTYTFNTIPITQKPDKVYYEISFDDSMFKIKIYEDEEKTRIVFEEEYEHSSDIGKISWIRESLEVNTY